MNSMVWKILLFLFASISCKQNSDSSVKQTDSININDDLETVSEQALTNVYSVEDFLLGFVDSVQSECQKNIGRGNKGTISTCENLQDRDG